MSQTTWIKIDIGTLDNPPRYLEAGDWCCFLREYTSHGGFDNSVGNDDISNFKKNPQLAGSSQWKWKEYAANKFAQELAALFRDKIFHVCVMPSSKIKGDPEYDPRFDMMLKKLKLICPNLVFEEPIKKRVSTQPLHERGKRDVESLYRSLEWVGFQGAAPETLCIVDDMITWGTSFKASKRLVIEHCPGVKVCGIFWTRCVWRSDFPPECVEK